MRISHSSPSHCTNEISIAMNRGDQQRATSRSPLLRNRPAMKIIDHARGLNLFASTFGLAMFAGPLAEQVAEAADTSPPPAAYSELPSETPDRFERVTNSFDHVRRDVMNPMRDGVKLHTVILHLALRHTKIC